MEGLVRFERTFSAPIKVNCLEDSTCYSPERNRMNRNAYMREYRQRTKKLCPVCEKTNILKTSTTCHSCREVPLKVGQKDETGTLGDLIYTNSHRSSAYALVRSRARSSLKKELQAPRCEECGYSKHVEVCHIRPIGSFPLETRVIEINDRDNLKLLCPNCHWEFDHPQ